MRESGEKVKNAGELKAFPQKNLYLFRPPLPMSGLGDFVVKAPLQNYKNNIVKPITIGAKKEENQKRQKAKRAAGIQQGMMNSG